jgi:hypothetical protein
MKTWGLAGSKSKVGSRIKFEAPPSSSGRFETIRRSAIAAPKKRGAAIAATREAKKERRSMMFSSLGLK